MKFIMDFIQGVVDRATDPNSPMKDGTEFLGGKTFLGKIIDLGTIPFWGLTLFLFVLWNIITDVTVGNGWFGTIIFLLGCIAYGFFIVGPHCFDDRSPEE